VRSVLAICTHRQAQVGGCVAAHLHRHGGLVGLMLVSRSTRPGGSDLVHHQPRQALELLEIRALQRELDLLLPAHRIEQADMGDGDARHLRQPRAQGGGDWSTLRLRWLRSTRRT
jgi:hypothetical protein